MPQQIALIALVVADYDDAIRFYTETLGFSLIEDTYQPEQNKRWVVIAPKGAVATHILLARACSKEQKSRVGNQAGGRVFLFLHTDNFWRDYHAYQNNGVRFLREPSVQPYGTVAVFYDLYGNQWDLVQPTTLPSHSAT